jgi:nitronate monooxygenase
MALRTAFTDLISVEHPVVLAPMSGTAGGALAAAVSNAGGLGLVGGGRQGLEWCREQLGLVVALTSRPWGIGFLTWGLETPTLAAALEQSPAAVMLSFGDPHPFADLVHQSGAQLIIQVTDLEEARQALDTGADVVVAQGTEAGGHGGVRSTFPFVPAVVDVATHTPVLAAGGIADGRGLAAALALGAAGALIGTRFEASQEALVSPETVKAIVDGTGEGTSRSRVFDIANGSAWPATWTGRALRNPFFSQWLGKEDELAHDDDVLAAYQEHVSQGDMSYETVWAGEAIDLIDDDPPAGELVTRIANEAEQALNRVLSR